ncbi:MAG TPA: hypothetical protein PLE19_02985 [Planctomycetota bacterium]|nr:hypothetical protein [Planctomycetota bacterium]HRT94374.1 hypothetical protein [Planctomycetota bacterium]
MRNDYGQLVEAWKVDLILDRARRKGFRPDELEDVQQDVIQAVMDFRFEPEKSNGATENTALTALIDKQLTFIQRGRARHHKHHERFKELMGVRDGQPVQDAMVESQERAVALALDVRDAVARLTPQEQVICAALSRGENRFNIAKAIGVSRYELDRAIDRIREQFEKRGLDAWVRGL